MREISTPICFTATRFSPGQCATELGFRVEHQSQNHQCHTIMPLYHDMTLVLDVADAFMLTSVSGEVLGARSRRIILEGKLRVTDSADVLVVCVRSEKVFHT